MTNKIFLLLFFLTSSLSAATVTRYVNPGSSGGDGTTAALTGANAAYVSLSAWEAAEGQDLTDGGGDIMLVNCAGTTADTLGFYIDGWTTGTANYISIVGDNTSGKWNTAAYRIEEDDSFSSAGVIGNNENYVRFNRIQLKLTCTSAKGNWREGFNLSPAGTINGEIWISNCVIWGAISGTATYAKGITAWYLGATMTVNVWNNIIYGWDNASTSNGIDDYLSAATWNVYNNTIYGCYYGIDKKATTWLLKNNICYNNTYDYDDTAPNSSSTHNLSKDATAPALGTYYQNKTLTFTNTTADSEDFHLISGDTDAIDKGTDLSATFTDDIDGVTRSGTWDIGADEYVSGEAPPAGALYNKPIIFCE